jgi:protein-disulfide isomerase
MNRNILLVASAVLLLGGFAIGASMYRSSATAAVDAIAREESKTLVPDHAQRLGDPAARVVIVEFFDPACETCAKFAPVAKGLVERNPGRVQLVLRYAAFHPGSDTMVAILEASRRQDKYWETLEIMFATQSEWASHHDPQPDRIWPLLESGGLDVARLRADMTDPAIAAVIAADTRDAEKLGVKKTPSFFVNEKPLTKFGQPQLTALVESEIAAVY